MKKFIILIQTYIDVLFYCEQENTANTSQLS